MSQQPKMPSTTPTDEQVARAFDVIRANAIIAASANNWSEGKLNELRALNPLHTPWMDFVSEFDLSPPERAHMAARKSDIFHPGTFNTPARIWSAIAIDEALLNDDSAYVEFARFINTEYSCLNEHRKHLGQWMSHPLRRDAITKVLCL